MVTLVTLLSFFGMAIVALLFYRRVQLETQLANFWWSIKWEDISFPERSRKSASSLATNDEGLSKGSPVRRERGHERHICRCLMVLTITLFLPSSQRFGGACSTQGGYGDVHVGVYKVD